MTDWKVRDLELFRHWSLNGDGPSRAMSAEAARETAMSKVARRNRSRAAEALWCVAIWAVFLLWWGGGKVTLLLYVITCLLVSWAYFCWVETPLHLASRKLVAKLFPARAGQADGQPT